MCSSFSGLDGDFHTAYFTSLAWTSCWDLDFQKPLSCGHLSILSTMKYSNPDSSSASLPLHPVLHFSSRFWLHHSHICPSLDEPFICKFLVFVYYSHLCCNLLHYIPSKYIMSSLCPWNQEQTSCLDSHHPNLHMASRLR